MKNFSLAIALLTFVAGQSLGASYYWDTDTTSVGNDSGSGSGLGGGGTWDVPTANWWDGVANSALLGWTDGNDAIFTGFSGFVTIPAGDATTLANVRSATGLAFHADGYEIGATGSGTTGVSARGSIALTGSPSIVVDPFYTATITARMTGTAGYSLSGGGKLVVNEPANLNSISGAVSVTGGSTLELSKSGQIGSTGVGSGNVTLDNGTFRNTDATVGGVLLTPNRSIIVGTGGATIDVPNSGQILLHTGSILGPGNTTLTKIGAGEARFYGTTPFTFQKLVISEGTYTLGQASTLGSDAQLGAVPGSPLADAVTLNGGTLRFVGGSGVTTTTTDVNRGFTLTDTGVNTFRVDNSNAAIPGKITGLGGFNKTGGLMLTLSGDNDYQGQTNINAGTLRVTNTTGSATGSGAIFINNTATLSGTGSVSGSITLSAGGKIAAGIGGGNSVLTVPNADFSFGTYVDATLGASGNSDVLNVTTQDGLNLNGGTLTLTAVSDPSNQTFTIMDYNTSFTGDLSSMIINNATGYDATVTNDATNTRIRVSVGNTVVDRTWIDDDGGNWAFAEGFSWSTGSEANGIGSIARFGVTSPNNPSQTVTISDISKTVGTVILDNAAASYTIAASSTSYRLVTNTYSGNAAINVLNGSHSITARMTFTASTDVNVTGTNVLTTSTAINNGGMTKTGTGTLLITTGDWTGSGATNINEGVLQYSNDNAAGLSNLSTINIGAAGTLDFNADSTHKVNDQFAALAGSGKFVNHGNLTLSGANTTPAEFTGTMGLSVANGGNGDPYGDGVTTGRIFTKNGAGTQIISGTLEATGNFTLASAVNGGKLILNNPSGTSLTSSTAALTVNTGATLGGNGYVAGPITIATGGTIAPGNSIGTFHADGALTLSSGSKLSFELDTVSGNDVSDQIIVGLSNGLTINGGTLDLIDAGSMTAGTYTLIDYNTSFGGLLSNLVLGAQPAGFTYSLVDNVGNTSIDLQVATAGVPGDYNNNGIVDAADYVLWRKGGPLQNEVATIGSNTAEDYTEWRARFGNTSGSGSGSSLNGGGAVPEPAALAAVLIGLAILPLFKRERMVG